MLDSYSRRHFLKLSAALLAGGAAAAAGAPSAHSMGRGGHAQGELTQIKGYCPFCQAACTYQAQVRDGVLTGLIGETGNRWTGGAMCPKGMSIAELINSPYRLTEPMLRQPDGSWKRITYQEAVSLTAAKLKEAAAKKNGGNRIAISMPLWDCRESEIFALMTMHKAGSQHAMPPGETCVSSASNMLALMTGVSNSTTTVDEVLNAHTLILWGGNICELYPPYTRWLTMAREKGVKIVYVDPRRTRTSAFADLQLQPLPGTDGMLAMGALRYLFETGAFDEARAKTQIDNLDMLREDVADYTLDKVCAITGVDADHVLAFFRAVAASPRTIVWMGGALSRYTNGIQCLRALMLMQGLKDNVIGAGKGLLTMQSGKPAGEHEFLEHVCGKLKGAKMNFRRLRMAMQRGALDVLFLNSSYRRYPDANGVRKAIQKVPFVVQRGFFLTEETEVAHLFVPATFGPESQGSRYGLEKQVVWREKILKAPGSCVPDWQFYRDVGRAAFGDQYPPYDTPEDIVKAFCEMIPSWKGMTLERLRTSPDGALWPLYHEGDAEQPGTMFRDGKLFTPNGMMPVNAPVFGRLKWGYPKGNPFGEDKDPKFPLVLTQGKVVWQWQQTLTNFSQTIAQFGTDGRMVSIHPETAKKYGLANGDRVMLETSVGGLEARVVLSFEIRPDIVFTPSYFTASSPIARNKSPHINTILPNYWDRISCQHNGTGCRLRKI